MTHLSLKNIVEISIDDDVQSVHLFSSEIGGKEVSHHPHQICQYNC